MLEEPQDPDRSAYDPTGLAPGAQPPGELQPLTPLPPLREVTELRKPSTLGGVIYLAVLGVALLGIVVATTGAWRTGVSWLAAALIGAAAARVILPEGNAGMLRVRRKWADAFALLAVGAVLVFLVGSIPDQPR